MLNRNSRPTNTRNSSGLATSDSFCIIVLPDESFGGTLHEIRDNKRKVGLEPLSKLNSPSKFLKPVPLNVVITDVEVK